MAASIALINQGDYRTGTEAGREGHTEDTEGLRLLKFPGMSP